MCKAILNERNYITFDRCTSYMIGRPTGLPDAAKFNTEEFCRETRSTCQHDAKEAFKKTHKQVGRKWYKI